MFEQGEEGGVDGLVDDDTGARDAAGRVDVDVSRMRSEERDMGDDVRLAGCHEGGEANSVDGVLEVGVGEDDDRCLSFHYGSQ